MGENRDENGASFEERLRAARARQGLDGSPDAESRSAGALDGSAWSIGLRVGAELVGALAVGLAIGWLLDRWLGTRPIFLGVFLLLGGAAGIRNVWRLLEPGR